MTFSGLFFSAFFFSFAFESLASPKTVFCSSPSMFPVYFRNSQRSLPYVSSQAHKGGVLKITGKLGGYQSLNPMDIIARKPEYLDWIYASLFTSLPKDPYCLYAYAAESLEVIGHTLYITIRNNASFHTGHRITGKDILATYQYFIQMHPSYYEELQASIVNIKAHPQGIEFVFKNKPSFSFVAALITMPLLPACEILVQSKPIQPFKFFTGSGPYRISHYSVPDNLELHRVKDWWGECLPINKYRYNFDSLEIQYYKTSVASLEALKKGELDLRIENKVTNWMETKEKKSDLYYKIFPKSSFHGYNALFFNSQNFPLNHKSVRQALYLLFDFEVLNKKLFLGSYLRNKSILMNTFSEDPYNDSCAFIPTRERIDKALYLLESAGWIRDKNSGSLIHRVTGEKLTVRLILPTATLVRVFRSYQEMLRQVGIELKLEYSSSELFIKKLRQKDYDLLYAYLPPVRQVALNLLSYWGSEVYNYAQIPLSGVYEKILKNIQDSTSLKVLKDAAENLNDFIMKNYYTIPLWHPDALQIAFSKKLKYPEEALTYGFDLSTWWIEFKS